MYLCATPKRAAARTPLPFPGLWIRGNTRRRIYKVKRASGPNRETHFDETPKISCLCFILPCPKSTSGFVSVERLST